MGYEFGDERQVRIEKKVGGTVLGWCLGATIELVGGGKRMTMRIRVLGSWTIKSSITVFYLIELYTHLITILESTTTKRTSPAIFLATVCNG
jgi:hypothetical protein